MKKLYMLGLSILLVGSSACGPNERSKNKRAAYQQLFRFVRNTKDSKVLNALKCIFMYHSDITLKSPIATYMILIQPQEASLIVKLLLQPRPDGKGWKIKDDCALEFKHVVFAAIPEEDDWKERNRPNLGECLMQAIQETLKKYGLDTFAPEEQPI